MCQHSHPAQLFLPRMGAQHVCWERLVCVPITILRDNHRCPQCSPLHTSGTVLSSHQTNTSSSSSRKFSNYLLSVGAAGACGGEEERSLTETITASLPVATDHPQPTTHPQTPRTPANTEQSSQYQEGKGETPLTSKHNVYKVILLFFRLCFKSWENIIWHQLTRRLVLAECLAQSYHQIVSHQFVIKGPEYQSSPPLSPTQHHAQEGRE